VSQPDYALSHSIHSARPSDVGYPHGSIHVTDEALDVAFFVFHTSWIAFTCLGWIWRRTRRWHLAVVSLTVLSWFGLGVRYGWGYCPLTDWHWDVRARLGHVDPPSYIQLLIREAIGVDVGAIQADTLAVVTLVVVTVGSVVLHRRDRRAA
jgi:hypothetical protein